MERFSFFQRLVTFCLVCVICALVVVEPLTVNAQLDSIVGAGVGAVGAIDTPTIADRTPEAVSPVVTTIGANIPAKVDAVYQNIRWQVIGAGVTAFMNTMQLVFGTLAYDAADYLATGGKGQSALFYKKGFGGYLADVGGSAAGEFIGSISQSTFFQQTGFDLCRPPDPKTLLRIQLSLGQFLPNGTNSSYSRPQAKCDFNNIVSNYEQVYQTLSNTDVLSNVNASLNTNSNDLGVSFLIFNRAATFVGARQTNATNDRKEGSGYQALTDVVSGRIRTPSATVQDEANQMLVKDPKANQETINTFILQSAWNLGPKRLAIYTASVFVNTFSSRLLKRIFEGGIDSINPLNLLSQGSSYTTGGADDLLVGNAQDSRNANIDLRTPNLFKDQAYDVVSEMQACPSNRGTWNCTLDDGLGQALHTQSDSGLFTIRQALDQGFLKKDWRLFPTSNNREESDPLCYTYGYCSGNLRKLRLLRIIPDGFEFAANDPTNIGRCSGAQGCVTLGEVVSGFVDCNASGERDAMHPWCKLIDPNWSLTSFPQQCALTGYGDVLLTSGMPERREECQDIQTCLQRNDKGECVGGYGQCVSEKVAYRFGGQECLPQFASCRTYTGREGGSAVSYLRNTLDYGTCSADNVGCLWYATKRDPSNPSPNAWIGTVNEGSRVYFDKTMATCEASGEGCTKLLAVQAGVKALNLVENSSFESIGADGALNAWDPLATPAGAHGFVRPNVTDGDASAEGVTAASFASNYEQGYRQVVDLQPGHNYVVSAFVRRYDAAGGTPNVTVGVRQFDTRASAIDHTNALPASTITRDFKSTECQLVGSTGDLSGAVVTMMSGASLTSTWNRVECSFTADTQTVAGEVVLRGTNTLVDAVMLEEGTVAGRYIDGVNQSLEAVYHKVAPEEYHCTGASTDPAQCANYAKACKQTEAGCDGYTDMNGAFPEVSAQIGNNDFCPNSCVGYAEYRKLPSAFDLVQSATPEANDASEPRSQYFIPSTAQQCTEETVGCSEFTDVGAADAGGEAKAYFTSLRFCEKPANDSATYFTWEGSDSAGYQLRTWSLKKRTTEKPGDVPSEGAAITDAAGPRIAVKRSGDLFSQKDPANCNEMAWRTGAEPDCRQFYDAAGHVFYRYYSQTVLSTDLCKAYRLNGQSQDDCTKTGGEFNSTSQTCTYQAFAPESGSCTANYAGCRAFAGAEAGNLRTVYSATGSSTDMITGGRISSEALVVGDKSYRLDVAAGATAAIGATFPSAQTALYRVTFWAKSTASSTVVLTATTPTTCTAECPPVITRTVGSMNLTTDWQQVTLGLFDGSQGAATKLNWTVSASPAGPIAFFIGNINVQQMRDLEYVKQGTWNTPTECDQNAYGVPEPQAMVGCRAYKNRDGVETDARQFSQLCKPEAIGCREFIDTRNSDNPYRQRFTLQDTAGASVTEHPAARYIYVIDDKSRRCDAAVASCRAFGKPTFTPDRQAVASFDTVYLMDDVTKYGDGLCKPSQLFCEEFSTDNGKEYFKDPQNHQCTYREQVDVSSVPGVPDGTYNGWFINGQDVPCYPNALASGQIFQVLKAGDTSPDPGYQGWGAVCPDQQAECTEFRDPAQKTSADIDGRPYYFINDSLIDKSSCNGTVDPSQGCVLLRNMSDSRLLYSSEATAQSYQANKLKPVVGTDCQADPMAAGCSGVTTGRCVGTSATVRYTAALDLSTGVGTVTAHADPAVLVPYSGSICSQDSDCAAEGATTTHGATRLIVSGGSLYINHPEFVTHVDGIRCDKPSLNDSNLIVKVQIDRDCAQWLGCQTGETVYDPATNQYRDECTKMALCDKGTSQSGASANYCSNYINRDTTSTEPVLTAGAYFDVDQYVKRSLTKDARDYSGYTLPNAFQVVDLQSRSVAKDIPSLELTDPSAQRLVVAVKMPPIDAASLISGRYRHVVPALSPDQAEAIPRTDPLYQSVNQNILLCRHRGTGMVGYFLRDEATKTGQQVNCYLSFRDEGQANAFTATTDRLKASHGAQDLLLDESYPRPLCRAYPESDAPFPSSVVTKWDMKKNPFAPAEVEAGLESANVCGYGEDCLCSYKRVRYPGIYKPLFFDTASQAVPPGVCIGGPRDGQACLPSNIFDVTASTSTSVKTAQAANNNQSCGSPNGGGQCVAFDKAEIVRGVMGSCLEYDTTHGRGVAGNQTYPCLVWNPSPIVGGQDDPYRYVQTAGYFPPQNAGQYYCASNAKAPRSKMLTGYDFLPGLLPDNVTNLQYDDKLTSSGGIGATGNEIGAYFHGLKPEGSATADQCEDADDDQDDGGFGSDPFGLRLVATGRDNAESYTETFYGINPKAIASWLYKQSSESTTVQQRLQAIEEQNISYINIQPFENPNGNGRLACGYQEDWVDGVHVDDYNDLDKTAPADRQWRQNFFGTDDLSTNLTRGNEEVLADPDHQDKPLMMPCLSLSDGTVGSSASELGSDHSCYYKTWEIGYRSKEQTQKFVAFQHNPPDDPVLGTVNQDRMRQQSGGFASLLSPVYERCTADKPYYAIRAVFQTDAATQASPGSITLNGVRGPWRMIGFWVSACAGKASGDNRYIYMNVRWQSADICKDLVEVKSAKTNQDAAFTDRVWRNSKYTVPILGIEYGKSFAPFSSALNTKTAGVDPLFQMGSKLAGSSAINPPTFLASGFQTYYGPILSVGTPRGDSRYAYLSNLFARIYRVYHFSEARIQAQDDICTSGPFVGRRCVPDSAHGTATDRGPSVDCRAPTGAAACDIGSPPPPDYKVCNALSGINAGQSCGSSPDSCHLYAKDFRASSNPVPLLTRCEVNTAGGWRALGNGDYTNITGDTRGITKQQAAPKKAFRCAPGAVRLRDYSGATSETVYCTDPDAGAHSQECPIEIIGSCKKPTTANKASDVGLCEVNWYGSGSTSPISTGVGCYMDNDCSFNITNFWRDPSNALHFEQQIDGISDVGYDVTHYGDRFSGRFGVVAPHRLEQIRVGSDVTIFQTELDSRRFTACGVAGCSITPSEVMKTIKLFTTSTITQVTFAPDPITYLTTYATETQRYPGANPSNTFGLEPMYDVGACVPFTDLVSPHAPQLIPGTCGDGSAHQGNACLQLADGARFAAGSEYLQGWATSTLCTVAGNSATDQGECDPVSVRSCDETADPCPPGHTIYTPVSSCLKPGAPTDQATVRYYEANHIAEADRNLNNDNNSCTTEVGYVPDSKLCPDPSDEFCGLVSYDMRAAAASGNPSLDGTNIEVPLPTDVTLGFYTPTYLGSGAAAANYQYIDYYTPRPPRIAAPSVGCAKTQSCGVQDLDRFNFNGVTQGIINVVGGQYRSIIKFYGWAAHEQMAIRHLAIDWGDGAVQDFDDVKLKNHKPFCSVQKECFSSTDGFTGLTCETDTDCPLSAQACRSMGSCHEKQNMVCGQDSDCQRDGSKDTCDLREFFGNSADACQASPFEFSHVYTCPDHAASVLPSCSGQSYQISAIAPDFTGASDIVAPAPAVGTTPAHPGTCYFGVVDSLTIEAGHGRSTCTVSGSAGDAECSAAYQRIWGRAPATTDIITCGPPAHMPSPVSGADGYTIPVTQARCSNDTTRFCRVNADCATGDSCIAVGLAPPNGCWDVNNNVCRYTPRVFIQDNWGWCTGECRSTMVGGTLQDSPTSPIRHAFGGCYTPVPDEQTEKAATRYNTQPQVNIDNPNRLIGAGIIYNEAVNIECKIDRPIGALPATSADPRRNFRPWIVFPGSVQLRPRS